MSEYKAYEPSLPLFLHVAIGVFIGSLAAAAATWAFVQWKIEREMQAAAHQIQQVAAEQSARARAETERLEALAAASRAASAAQRRDEELQRRAFLELRAKREEAWARYYRKPAACDESKGGAWSVDCANDFIRAKRRFDELFDAGKL